MAILDWLNKILSLSGWSPSRLAKEAGLAPSTVNRILAGADHVLSTTTIGRIEAAACNRVRDRVAAGEIDWSHDSRLESERLVVVKEIDSRDAAGERAIDSWGFPETWLRFSYGSRAPDQFRIVALEDDAMWPDYKVGDRVMVDTSLRSGSPAGVYLFFDGVSWTPRHLEVLPEVSPPTVMIKARNPEYMSREARLDALKIMGRVVGMWRRV